MPTNNKTQKLVPELRFPQFSNQWTPLKLIDVADKKVRWSFIGGPFGSNLKASDYTPSGIRVLQLQNIGDSEFINSSKIYTSVEKADELLSNNIYPGEIILSKMGDPVGRACLIPGSDSRYVMCSDGIRLVVDEGLHSKYFVYSQINSASFRKTVEASSTGSTRKRIGLDILKNLPFLIPELPEQQKIADCLGSLDELLAAHRRKLASLQDHKKGLLQQLFPAEGQTTPNLRFPGFEGEWEEKELETITVRGSGHTPNKKHPEYYNGGIKWISLADSNRLDNGTIAETAIEISEQGIKNSSAKLHPAGCVVLSRDAGVGKSAVMDCDMAVSQHFIVWKCKNALISNWFLYYHLQKLKPFLEMIATGSTIKTIGLPFFKSMTILLPSRTEQQKIAECLSALDALITAQTDQIAALQAHKKGLMQKLFPNPEAVA